jgi:YD repeat-containing protein
MRFVVALTLVLASTVAMAEPQRQTFRDMNGREFGRSVSDGRNTTFRDSMGRMTARAIRNGNTTTTYDSFGRRTGSISR